MTASFKNQINKHYASASLNKNQLERLKRMQADANEALDDIDGKAGPVDWLKQRLKLLQLGGIAASLLVLSIFVTTDGELSDSIVSEIAYNHNKMAAMEITSSSITEVADYLQKLDFSPITSKRFGEEGWELVGGRYCSIQGELAAQLRVKDKATGKVMTLYQSRIPQELDAKALNKTDKGIVGFDDGVMVELWQEKGLLMGLAESDNN